MAAANQYQIVDDQLFDLTTSSSGSDAANGRMTNVPTRPADPVTRTLSMMTPSLTPVTERNVMRPSTTSGQPTGKRTHRSSSPSMQFPMLSHPLPKTRALSSGPNTVSRSPAPSMAVEQAQRTVQGGQRANAVTPGEVRTREHIVTVSPLVLPPVGLPRTLPT